MPATLTPDRRTRAVTFLTTVARPLERARYRFHFENGPGDNVFEALRAYQNDDGGFGHALEPDLRLPDSSVLATTIAFQVFRELCPSADHPLVESGCAYLRDTHDAENLIWWITPPNADNAPHAPWWTVGEGPRKPTDYALNPRAEIAGYLHDYANHFPDAMRKRVTNDMIDHLLARDTVEIHELLCMLRFYDTPNLRAKPRDRVTGKLTSLVRDTVEQDPTKWGEYNLQPVDVATTPESPFAALFGDKLHANLDARIDQQEPDGSWQPPWSWGDAHPDVWPQVKREWAGILTLKNLRILDAYGRLR